MKDIYEDMNIGFEAQSEYEPQPQEEQHEEKEHKILNFLDYYGEDIAKIAVGIILVIMMFFAIKYYNGKIKTVEVKEEYTTATVVGFDEKTTSRYGRYKTSYFKTYYIELDINGNTIKEENEKLYITSNIGDVYKIKLTGNFNKYDELLDYEITFIEKVEKDERD